MGKGQAMNEQDRDRILQMVAYIREMNYQQKQAMMDNSNWRKLLEALDDAYKLCPGVVESVIAEDKRSP